VVSTLRNASFCAGQFRVESVVRTIVDEASGIVAMAVLALSWQVCRDRRISSLCPQNELIFWHESGSNRYQVRDAVHVDRMITCIVEGEMSGADCSHEHGLRNAAFDQRDWSATASRIDSVPMTTQSIASGQPIASCGENDNQ